MTRRSETVLADPVTDRAPGQSFGNIGNVQVNVELLNDDTCDNWHFDLQVPVNVKLHFTTNGYVGGYIRSRPDNLSLHMRSQG